MPGPRQVFTHRHVVGSGSGLRSYHPFIFADGTTISAGAGAVPLPIAGTLRNLRVTAVTGVLPASGTDTVSLYVNGVVSALTGTLNSTTAAFTNTSTVAVAAGDTVELREVTNTSAGAHTVQISLEFEAVADNTALYGYGGCGDAFSTSTYENGLFFHGGSGAWVATVVGNGDVAPVAGTVTEHVVRLTAAPGAGNARTFTIWKNGVAQDGTSGTPDTRVTITDTATLGSRSFALPVAAGDRLKVRLTSSGTPATGRAQAATAFVSAAPNELCYGGSYGTNPGNTATLYTEPFGFQSSPWTATETDFTHRIGPTSVVLQGLRVDVTNAPGAGRSCTYTLRRNGAGTALTVTLSETAVTASVTATVTLVDGDTIAFESTPANLPVQPGNVRWSFAAGPASAAQPVTTASLAPSAQLFAPTVTGVVTVTLGTILSTVALFSPGVALGGAILLGLATIPTTTGVFAPAVFRVALPTTKVCAAPFRDGQPVPLLPPP